MTVDTTAWTLADWQAAYRRGQTPHALLTALLARLSAADPAFPPGSACRTRPDWRGR